MSIFKSFNKPNNVQNPKSGTFQKDDICKEVIELAPIILEEVQKSKNILLHCHPSPDPDSVCSVLAIKSVLESLGKKVTAIRGDSKIPTSFGHFPGVSSIVDKDFFEIDLSEYDLFIALDSGSPNMVSGHKPVIFPDTLKVIVIDHHASNTKYGSINLVPTTAPATAFVLFQLFKAWNIEINHDIAVNLFMGMYTDTLGFKTPLSDYKLFEACMECVKIAPDFSKNIFIMENSDRPQSIYFQALSLNNIELFLNDNIVISAVSYTELQSKDISVEDILIGSISNTLKSVIGWNVGVSMVEVAPKSIKVSFRTRDSDKFNVSKLAVALGGGGHVAAAGVRLNGYTIDEAKTLIVSKAKEVYNL